MDIIAFIILNFIIFILLFYLSLREFTWDGYREEPRNLTTEQYFNNFLQSEYSIKRLICLINEEGGIKMFQRKTEFTNDYIDRDFEFYQNCYTFMDIEYEILRKAQLSHIEIVKKIVKFSGVEKLEDDICFNISEVRAFGTYIFFWVNKGKFEKELNSAIINLDLDYEKLKP